MTMKKLLVLVLLAANCPGYAQNAISVIHSLLDEGKNAEAFEMIAKYSKKNKGKAFWHIETDNILRKLGRLEERPPLLSKALEVKKLDNRESVVLALAGAYSDLYRFRKADSVLALLPQNKTVQNRRSALRMAGMLYGHPADVSFRELENTNTVYDNIWPFADNSGDMLLFTVAEGKSTPFAAASKIRERIYVAHKTDSAWGPANRLPAYGDYNIGAACIGADGKYVFFTLCDSHKGCRIMYAPITSGNKIGEASELPGSGNFRWQSCPALSPASDELFFSAIDKQGKNKRDIYRLRIFNDGNGNLRFSEAERLPFPINTGADETAPFLNPYGNRLYFASDRIGGMGGMDIYYCERDSAGNWGKASNMGFPVNTWADESGFTVNADASCGYLSSQTAGGKYTPNKRIYAVRLPESHSIGNCFETKDSLFTLQEILFDINDSRLQAASLPLLDELARYLAAHPSYRIIINGHCDDSGNEERNAILSRHRAESVRNYLRSKGISAERMICKGFGSSRPAVSGDDEAARRQNRRIEVEIVR